MRVAIIYDAFPHYRKGVMQELIESSTNQYIFVGAKKYTKNDIKTWWPQDSTEAIVTRSWHIAGKWLVQQQVVSIALRNDIDALIFLGNPYFLTTWLAGALGRLRGKRVLFWTHGWQRDDRGAKDWLRRLFFHIPHGLLLYGERARSLAMSRGFAPERLFVIYNSLDYETQRSLRARTSEQHIADLRANIGIATGLPILVCTARLTKDCRFELLFEAASLLRAQGSEVHIVLVGDGRERGKLSAYAQKLGVRATFLGECYEEKIIGPLVMAAAATVSPGKVGLTAMHSLAYGTPVITHSDMDAQRPEVEAVIHGKTGLLFRRDDVHDLADKIQELFRIYSVPEKRNEIRANCIRIIEQHFTPSYQKTRIEQALRVDERMND
jgi:glycosyltransferase involved in cell wall biosynthesis